MSNVEVAERNEQEARIAANLALSGLITEAMEAWPAWADNAVLEIVTDQFDVTNGLESRLPQVRSQIASDIAASARDIDRQYRSSLDPEKQSDERWGTRMEGVIRQTNNDLVESIERTLRSHGYEGGLLRDLDLPVTQDTIAHYKRAIDKLRTARLETATARETSGKNAAEQAWRGTGGA